MKLQNVRNLISIIKDSFKSLIIFVVGALAIYFGLKFFDSKTKEVKIKVKQNPEDKEDAKTIDSDINDLLADIRPESDSRQDKTL